MHKRFYSKAFIAGAFIFTILVLTIFWVNRSHHSAPAHELPNINFAANTEYLFKVTWTTQQQAQIPFGDGRKVINDHLNLVATMSLQQVNSDNDGIWLQARIVNLDILSMTTLERQVFKDLTVARDVVVNRPWHFRLARSGAIQSIKFAKTDSELFKNFMQAFLTHLQLQNKTTESALPNFIVQRVHGKSMVAASWQKIGEEFLIKRKLMYYTHIQGDSSIDLTLPESQKITGETRILLNVAGSLKSIDDQEDLLIFSNDQSPFLKVSENFQLALIETKNVLTQNVLLTQAQLNEERFLGQVVISDEVKRKLLSDRAAGIDWKEIQTAFLKYGSSGDVPDHNRWFWRATGLLKLKPELALEFKKLFKNNVLGEKGRNLVFDMLASAGTKEAQKAMRDILLDESNDALFKSSSFAKIMCYQRFSFLDSPDSETMAFLLQQFRETNNPKSTLNDLTAKSYTLGSAIHALAKNDPAMAKEYVMELTTRLSQADQGAQQASLIRSLGNAGLVSEMEHILDYQEAADPDVRIAVATALRKMHNPIANQKLIQFLKDPIPEVQENAIHALAGHQLNDDDFHQLQEQVLEDHFKKDNDAAMVTHLSRELQQSPQRKHQIKKMLEFILQRSDEAPNLQGRVRTILQQISAQD